ncbi:MAG: hypothetical protein ACI9ON_003005 [Limisphaerales bacterium]|jgi:hypothetical protein
MTTLQRNMTEEDIRTRGWVDADENVNEQFKTAEQGPLLLLGRSLILVSRRLRLIRPTPLTDNSAPFSLVTVFFC